MLYDMLIGTFQSNDAIDWFAGILFWVILLFVVCFVGFGVFYLADTPPSYKEGVLSVERVDFAPVHTTTTYIMAGKVMVPQTIYHANAWTATGTIEGTELRASASYSQEIKIGSRIAIQYGFCRFSKDVRLR